MVIVILSLKVKLSLILTATKVKFDCISLLGPKATLYWDPNKSWGDGTPPQTPTPMLTEVQMMDVKFEIVM